MECPFCSTSNPIVLGKQAKEAHATAVLLANKALLKPLILRTTAVKSPLKRFAWFYKLTVEAAVDVALVVLLDWDMKRLSV